MAAPSFIEMVKGAAADLANAAAGAVRIFIDTATGQPSYKDESGTVVSLQGADAELTRSNHGNTGASEDVIVSAAYVHRMVLNAATVTLTTSSWPASGTPGIVLLELVQDATGGRVISWPGAVTWGSAGAPVLTTAANGVDFVTLYSDDGGTTIFASMPNRMGPAGGAIAIDYTFSTTTTDADPGSGLMRLDSATTASVTKIRADLNDRNGTTWTAVLDSLDDSTNTVKGHIRLFKSDDPTKWILFTVSAVDSSSGYRNITVAYVAQSGASPFVAGDPVTLAFTRSGDAGAAGAAGAAGGASTDTEAYMSADTTISSGALTDLTGMSLSLGAGNWEVQAEITGDDSGASACLVGLAIHNGTSVVRTNGGPKPAGGGERFHVTCSAKITLAGTTTVKAQGITTSGSTTVARKNLQGTFGAGAANTACRIHAIQVA